MYDSSATDVSQQRELPSGNDCGINRVSGFTQIATVGQERLHMEHPKPQEPKSLSLYGFETTRASPTQEAHATEAFLEQIKLAAESQIEKSLAKHHEELLSNIRLLLSTRCNEEVGALPRGQHTHKHGSITPISSDGIQMCQLLDKEQEIAFKWYDIAMRLGNDDCEQIMRSIWEKGPKESMGILPIIDDLGDPLDVAQGRRTSSLVKRATSAGTWRNQHLKMFKVEDCFTDVVMEPSSVRRCCWTFASLIVMIYDATVLSVDVYHELETTSLIKTLDRVSLIFWTLDIPVSFLSGTYVDGELQMRLAVIAKQYVRSWFGFDVCIVAPMWALLFVEEDSIFKQLGPMTRFIKLTRYLRIVRLAKFKRAVYMFPLQGWADTHLGVLAAKISQFFAGMLLWVHVSACVWYSIGSASENGWVYQHGWDKSRPELLYFLSLHWAAGQLQGSVDITPGTTLTERIYSVFAVIMSVIILASCLGKLTNIMMELQSLSTKTKSHREVRKYLSSNNVSLQLMFKVYAYLDVFGQLKSEEDGSHEQKILATLPINLRRAITTEVRGATLSGTPLFLAFSKIHRRFFERICCDALWDHFVMPDELIWGYGDAAMDMYFTTGGSCAYTKYTVAMMKFVTHSWNQLSSRGSDIGCVPCKVGVCLSEPVLWTHWTHRGDLNSTKHCTYITLSEMQFSTIAIAYAQTWGTCRKHAQAFVAYLNTIGPAEWSDLLSTSDLRHHRRKGNSERLAQLFLRAFSSGSSVFNTGVS